MKGLVTIPTQKSLMRAYNILQSRGRIAETDVIRFAEWARFDPRLGEILVKELNFRWPELDVMKLRRLNMASVWPQALAVILEHVESLIENAGDAKLFRHFKALVTESIKPQPYQSFSIGVFQPGGRQLHERAERPHPFFAKWGYYESEPFFNKAARRNHRTIMDRATRKRVLRDLLREKREITLRDYIEACRFAVHRRQAERDLNDFYKLRKTGNTRGRKYARI